MDNDEGEDVLKYDKGNLRDLKELLYNSYVHDAKFKNIQYQCGEDNIKIELINPIFNVKIILIFHGIEIAFAIKGDKYGSSETIISLTVEEDFSYLKTYLPKNSECMESCLYLLFQMFSGGELHIVSKGVDIEIII